ncbi:phosphoesterase, partial [Salinadaptatus halalkaliphilus]
EQIGQSDSTTFVMPQELTSMVGRYGKHLSGSDVKDDGDALESLDFDEETRELIGLDDIAEIIGEIDEEAEMDLEKMEQEAQAIKEGKDAGTISDPDEVIEEMDQDFQTDGGPEPTDAEEPQSEH